MKTRYFSSYIEGRELDYETIVKILIVVLALFAVLASESMRIGLIIVILSLLVAIRMANLTVDIMHMNKYRIPIKLNGDNKMPQSTIERKILSVKNEIQRKPTEIQEIHKNIARLDHEADNIRHQRIRGLLTGRGNIMDITAKERRLSRVVKEIKSLRKKENQERHRLTKEKADLQLATRFHDKALLGDESASLQAMRILSHY